MKKIQFPQVTRVQSQECPRDFRTEIPNIVTELLKMGLISPYSLVLYLVYRRIAGEHGACWVGSRQLEKECGFSRKTIYRAKKELMASFTLLGGKSLILNSPGCPAKEESDTVTIVDIWPENHNYFKNKLPWRPQTPPLAPTDTTPGAVGHHNKEPYKKEHKKNYYCEPPKAQEAPVPKPSAPAPTPPKQEAPVSACGANNNSFYKCLERASDLSDRQKSQFNKYPEADVAQAVEYLYHKTTEHTGGPAARMKRLHHACANPSDYRDTVAQLDAPAKPKLDPKQALVAPFVRGREYTSTRGPSLRFEFDQDENGVGFQLIDNGQRGHVYSVLWKEYEFKKKFMELLEKLGLQIPAS